MTLLTKNQRPIFIAIRKQCRRKRQPKVTILSGGARRSRRFCTHVVNWNVWWCSRGMCSVGRPALSCLRASWLTRALPRRCRVGGGRSEAARGGWMARGGWPLAASGADQLSHSPTAAAPASPSRRTTRAHRDTHQPAAKTLSTKHKTPKLEMTVIKVNYLFFTHVVLLISAPTRKQHNSVLVNDINLKLKNCFWMLV